MKGRHWLALALLAAAGAAGLSCARSSRQAQVEPPKPPAEAEEVLSKDVGDAREEAADSRPALWAQPMKLPGLPNLNKITDGLYRGAQPTAEGMRELEKLGVKTVVNLRLAHSDSDELAGTKLEGVRIKVEAWDADEDEVEKFLRAVTDPGKLPVFFHCKHGSDRTGMMCAVYRIVVQGWTNEEAAREMTTGGFGYHACWKDIVRYVRNLDPKPLRDKLGIRAPEAVPAAAGGEGGVR